MPESASDARDRRVAKIKELSKSHTTVRGARKSLPPNFHDLPPCLIDPRADASILGNIWKSTDAALAADSDFDSDTDIYQDLGKEKRRETLTSFMAAVPGRRKELKRRREEVEQEQQCWREQRNQSQLQPQTAQTTIPYHQRHWSRKSTSPVPPFVQVDSSLALVSDSPRPELYTDITSQTRQLFDVSQIAANLLRNHERPMDRINPSPTTMTYPLKPVRVDDLTSESSPNVSEAEVMSDDLDGEPMI